LLRVKRDAWNLWLWLVEIDTRCLGNIVKVLVLGNIVKAWGLRYLNLWLIKIETRLLWLLSLWCIKVK